MDYTKQLKHIGSLTAGNNHTGARWYIAGLFPYLSLYKRRFELINKLCEIDGSLNYDLGLYRKHVTDEMLDVIERKEGKELAEQIHSNL